MTPGPGTSWPAELDLDYFDDDQVDLDVAAIIARGVRIRRKRLLTRMAVVALIVGVGPAAYTFGQIEQHSLQPSSSAGGQPGKAPLRTISAENTSHGPAGDPNGRAGFAGRAEPPAGRAGAGTATGTAAGSGAGTGVHGSEKIDAPAINGTPSRHGLQPVQLVAKLTVTLPASYGSLQALAGASVGSGVWYIATASRIVLFHLSLDGAVSSWPVLAVSDLSGYQGNPRVGLAVTAAGVAWLGVDTRLVRVNTKTGFVSSWPIPAPRAAQPLDFDPRTHRHQAVQAVQSVAVSPAGHVAVSLTHSSGVQVLSPETDKFHEIVMPAVTDETEAVGYARDGALGIGYISLTGARKSGLMLANQTTPPGPILTAAVADARSVLPYGPAGLLVGIGHPDIVSATSLVAPLRLPVSPLDIAASTTPLVSLPDDRLAVAAGPEILSFPAYATSTAMATQSSTLYDPTPWCPPPDPELTAFDPAEPPGGSIKDPPDYCPQGYQMLATDQVGDIWVVPAARKNMVELLTVR